jgi:lipooligosaccharide transport system permease protein
VTALALRLVERNALVYRRGWILFVSGFFEPLFYLGSIGVGIGKLVGDVTGPGGNPVSYAAFVAPGLVASSAMNGALLDSTFNFFYKLRYAKTYEAVLATPLRPGDVATGEIAWALIRGALYAGVFLAVMLVGGLVHSAWAVLVVPAALLVGFTFSSLGLAAVTYCRSWEHMGLVQLAILPMFLFSGIFSPLSGFSTPVQRAAEVLPLTHGVAMMRALTLGGVGWATVGHAAYLTAVGLLAMVVVRRRLAGILVR